MASGGHAFKLLNLGANFGSDTFVAMVEWKAEPARPKDLTLHHSELDRPILCHILGTVLAHNFHMETHGDYLENRDKDFSSAALTFSLGPPTQDHVHKYGQEVSARFSDGLRNGRILSETADERGQGSGAGVDFLDGEPVYTFSMPIFKRKVRLFVLMAETLIYKAYEH